MKNSSVASSGKDFQRGFALLEVMIGVLIFSFGLLGLAALQANMIKSTSEARYRAMASYIAQQKLGELWADPQNIATQLENGLDVSAMGLPEGQRTVVLYGVANGASTVGVEVSWRLRGNLESAAGGDNRQSRGLVAAMGQASPLIADGRGRFVTYASIGGATP